MSFLKNFPFMLLMCILIFPCYAEQSRPNATLVCKGQTITKVDLSRPHNESQNLVIDIDFNKSVVSIEGDWGCPVDPSVSDRVKFLDECTGVLPVSIGENKVSYIRTTKGGVYSTLTSFALNRISGLFKSSIMASTNKGAHVGWSLLDITGEFSCTVADRKF